MVGGGVWLSFEDQDTKPLFASIGIFHERFDGT